MLLRISPDELEARSLDRVDRLESDWTEGMIAYYGSRQVTLDAMRASQQRRQDARALSVLPSIEIDTSAKDWAGYAEQIVEYWSASS